MKILWLINTIMPELAVQLGRTPSFSGGWLIGAFGVLHSANYELVICTTSDDDTLVGRYALNDAIYYVISNHDLEAERKVFQALLNLEKPDLIHIFGTEFIHSWALFSVADRNRTIITLQGLLSFCESKVYAGIPEKYCKDNLIHKLLRLLQKGGRSIELQRLSFQKRAEYEKQVLKNAKYINGLSDWGNAGVRSLNPDCELIECGSVLRDTFYDGSRWNAGKCEQHTILCIYTYPIKGFHKLLEAVNIVKIYYPDVKVYTIAKPNPYRDYKGIKKKLMDLAPDYEWYVQKLIEKYGLKEQLVFPGYLDAEEVKQYMLRSNVFVSASAIENQSTAIGEAMLLGLPTVISCAGDAENMILHGKEGFIYAFDQTQMLAYYICEIFGDRSLAVRISEGAHKKAAVLFGREKNGKQLLEMYDRVLNSESE